MAREAAKMLPERGVTLDIAKARARAAFEHQNESVADAWIRLGKDATAGQLADASGTALERVQQLMTDVGFIEEVLIRKLQARIFTTPRMREMVQGAIYY